MRFRTTLILAAIFAGLLAYVFLVEEPRRVEESKKKTLLTVQSDDVTGVTLKFADREIVLQKVDGSWRMVAPVEAPADSVAVTNLVNAAVQAEVTKDLGDAGGKLAQYGLDAPLVTVTLKAGDKTLPAVLVGKTTPIGAGAYAKLAYMPNVVLTSGALRAGMDKQVKDLRDKTILTFGDPELRQVELQGEGKDIVLTQEDGNWRIEKPRAMAADAATVRSFLSSLRSLRAVDFPADQPTDLAAFGLDKPRLRITLRIGEEGAEKTLLVGSTNDKKEMYVQRAGQPAVYAVSDWGYRDLDKSADDFRDKTIIAFLPADVRGLAVIGPDGTAKLTRGDGNEWRLEGSADKVSAAAVTQYLDEVREVKGFSVAADGPTDLAALGLNPPALTIALTGEGVKPLGTLLIGTRQTAAGPPEHTAMAGDGQTAFVVRDYLVKRLFKKPDAFLEKPTAGPGTPAPPAAQIGEVEDEELLIDEPVDPPE